VQGNKEAIRARLRRIEGQIRGVQRMAEEDAYCIDILTQISAANRALQAVALELLDAHLEHCVRDAIATGDSNADEKIAEASSAIARLVKS
jgi:DNA-binding FrmR family transcriptional regulator